MTGSAVFTTGDHALVAGGRTSRLTTPRGDDPAWADAVLHALRPRTPLAIGVLPFRATDPAGAILADQPRRLPRTALVEQAPAEPRTEAAEIREMPSADRFADAVRAAVDRLAAPDALGRDALRKVVLGRWLELDGAPSPADLLAALAARHPAAHLFRVPLGDGTQLVGASPELLVGRRGSRVRSTPLAGSVPRAADPVLDRVRAEALRDSAKDLHEHAFVVDAVADTLRPLCRWLRVPARPVLRATDTMWHLASPIEGELAEVSPATSALRLAQLLHPTPAVCGTPRDAAYRLIAELEPHDRGVLTGAVGCLDAAGDGDWAVTIRAGVVDGRRLRLFAGAGIVAGSDPDSEVAETQAKLETMLAAAGVVGAAAGR